MLNSHLTDDPSFHFCWSMASQYWRRETPVSAIDVLHGQLIIGLPWEVFFENPSDSVFSFFGLGTISGDTIAGFQDLSSMGQANMEVLGPAEGRVYEKKICKSLVFYLIQWYLSRRKSWKALALWSNSAMEWCSFGFKLCMTRLK